MIKKIGYIGLGKMGKNMVLRLLSKGWSVFAYDRTPAKIEEMANDGAIGVVSIKDMVSKHDLEH